MLGLFKRASLEKEESLNTIKWVLAQRYIFHNYLISTLNEMSFTKNATKAILNLSVLKITCFCIQNDFFSKEYS